MARVTLLLIAATSLLLVGCQGSESTSAPKGLAAAGSKPLPDIIDGLDCELDPAKCSIIRAGIDYLLKHANEMCKQAGERALQRFQAPPGTEGFRGASQVPENDMGVMMQPGLSASGDVAIDGYTDVYPSFWNTNTDPLYAGALIAHEEQHQNGMDNRGHTTGIALMYERMCLNPEP